MMRKRLLVGLIASFVAIFSIAPSAKAQNNLLSPCQDSALAALAEIQPAFETLIADAPSANDRSSFAPYIEAYFSWREGLWAQLPLCAEMLEIAVLMNRIASNQIAVPALKTLLQDFDIYDEADPYAVGDAAQGDHPDLLALQIEELAADLHDDARGSSEASGLAACADNDIDHFYADVYEPYLALAESFYRFRAYLDLFRSIETLAQWRAQVWRNLPACEGMAEMTWLMTLNASDLAALLSLHHADMKPEADLFNAEIARNSAAIAEMTPAFLGKATPDAQPPQSSLPGCARSQLNAFNTIILEYAELVNATEDIASVDDVFDFGRRQYDWREQRLADLPRCAEAFELGLLIDQSTGDFVIAMALLLAGVDASLIPHVEAIQASSAQMTALVTPIIQGERAGTDSPIPGPLPQCADAQLGQITAEIEPDYWTLIDADFAVETIEDLLALGEMQIEFREDIWRRLPACDDAYDIAWLMYRITSDSVITWALMAAGDAQDDISHSATALDMSRLNEMLNDIDAATAGSQG